MRPSTAPRRPAGLAASLAALLVVLTACGSARETTDRDAEVPRITGRPVPGTVEDTSDTADTAAAPTAPVRTSPTVAPTAPVATIPLPTSVTTTTPPPTPAPTTAAPVTNATVAPTPAPTTRPPTTAPPISPPTPPPTPPPTTPLPTSMTTTTTIAVTPGQPVGCAGADIVAATGVAVGGDLRCRAGWAVANRASCSDPAAACDTVDVFRVSGRGWIHDGRFDALAPCDFSGSDLAAAGMMLTTAEALLGACDTATPVDPVIVRPGTTGPAVLAVQVALVGQGYPIATDGTYGPRTEAAVRDFQARNGLEVDGISGPATQHALGIGPPPAGAAPTTAATTAATTSAPSTSAAPSTTIAGVGPREPRACSAEAIGTDIGRVVTASVTCRAGWAVAVRAGCAGAACSTVDVYQQASIGWVLIGEFSMTCAEGLMRSGMSPRVAASFADLCSTTLPERTNITPGSSGPAVANLQIALVAQGYVIGTDGTYGPRTEAAVRDWQQRRGLEVDGIAGPATQQSLGF
ncbi:peptidoglycan-binding domain-containing protein [Desertimonas flava]|uniref:peptidoglycan-binding domain-containing protein n=1 Tax=Desertimonas flava TaxID=2064846 RepID=UPI0013C4B75C|nr:peptidoglycan-binding domain-containing protein [Desertimonas flava]